MSAVLAEQDPGVSVSLLVRQLAEAEDEFKAHRDRLAKEHKAGLVLAGRIGDLNVQLAHLVGAGESVTVKVSGTEAVTVTIPPTHARTAPTCTRSRILR
jgi:hypothetical protein